MSADTQSSVIPSVSWINRTDACPATVASVVPTSSEMVRAATTAQEVEEASSLESSLVTPHKPWGRGYAGGEVRALFFVYTGPYEGTWEDTRTRVREVMELGGFEKYNSIFHFCNF